VLGGIGSSLYRRAGLAREASVRERGARLGLADMAVGGVTASWTGSIRSERCEPCKLGWLDTEGDRFVAAGV
jgi:hypothetical protein